jgi:hypothetical protein
VSNRQTAGYLALSRRSPVPSPGEGVYRLVASARLIQLALPQFLADITRTDLAALVVGDGPRERIRPVK